MSIFNFLTLTFTFSTPHYFHSFHRLIPITPNVGDSSSLWMIFLSNRSGQRCDCRKEGTAAVIVNVSKGKALIQPVITSMTSYSRRSRPRYQDTNNNSLKDRLLDSIYRHHRLHSRRHYPQHKPLFGAFAQANPARINFLASCGRSVTSSRPIVSCQYHFSSQPRPLAQSTPSERYGSTILCVPIASEKRRSFSAKSDM